MKRHFLQCLGLVPVFLLLLTSRPVGAMGLGDAIVRSYLGAPLHVEINLRATPEETVDEQCVMLMPANDGTANLGLRLRIVEGIRKILVIDSQRPVTEPFATLRIRLDCNGTALMREYALLIDPNPANAAAGPVAPPVVAAASDPANESSGKSGFPARGGHPNTARTAAAAAAAGPVRSRKLPPGSGRTAGPHPGRDERPGHGPQLRLDIPQDGLPTSTGTHAALAAPRSGLVLLRLDPNFDPTGNVTNELTAQREQLRELRALMLTDDDPVNRVATLQGQIGALTGQLHNQAALPPATGNGSSISTNGTSSSPAPATGDSLPAAASAVAATVPAGGAGSASVKALPSLQPHTGSTDAAGLLLWATGATALAMLAAGLLLIWHRRPGNRRADKGALMDQDLAAALLADTGNPALRSPGRASTRSASGTDDRLERGPAARPVATGHGKTASESFMRGNRVHPVTPAEHPGAGGGRTSGTPAAADGDTDLDDAQAARTAYLASRFPELGAGLIHLDDAESVVNGARLYVDHGDPDRAQELLETAIQGKCAGDVRPWLALFEVHRQREAVSPFALLLERFRKHFAGSRYIPEILAVGRQLDPGREDFKGPAGSRTVEVLPDGTTWLSPELDFVPQALAQDLHNTLMSEFDADLGAAASAPAGRPQPGGAQR